MLSPRVGIGGRLLHCVRWQVSNMSLLVSVSSRVLRHFIAVSSLSSTIHVGGWKVICHKLHLRGWLLSCGRWDETLRVCAVYYCDAYTDTHPYIFVSHVHTPNQFHTYTDTDSYILHTFFHAGAQDFVSNVQCLCNPCRAAPTYQTANARQVFTSQMVCLSAWSALPEPQAQLVAPVRTPANVKQDISRRQINSTSVASSAQTRPIAPRVALAFNR